MLLYTTQGGGGEIHIKASKENVSLLHVYRAVKIRSTIALNSTIARAS